LRSAAAAQWKVPAGEIRAENGELVHGTRKVSYGAMASAAAQQPVPADVPLKAPKDWKLIGKPLPRLDGADKARGKTVFGIDVVQPGMVYAALAACPGAGRQGRVVRRLRGREASRREEGGEHRRRRRGGRRSLLDGEEGARPT
jgi:CO/xanthine dehydrogenase Mo-binding subunit